MRLFICLFIFIMFYLSSQNFTRYEEVVLGKNSYNEDVLLFNIVENDKNNGYFAITDKKEIYDGLKDIISKKSINFYVLYIGEKKGSYFFSKNNVCVNFNFDINTFNKRTFYYSKMIKCGDFPFSEIETGFVKDSIEKSFEFENNKLKAIFYITNGENRIVVDNEQSFKYALKNYGKENIFFTTNFTGSLSEWVYNNFKIPVIYLRIDKIKDLEKYINNLNNEENENFQYKNHYNSFIAKSIKNFTGYDFSSDNEIIERIKKTFRRSYILPLVNKKNSLDADYVPDGLINIDNLILSPKKGMFLKRELLDDLLEMYNRAKSLGIELYVISSYRSYETQKSVYEKWVKTYGKEYADRISARPGHSQHQLGLAIDFNSLETSFENTETGRWLLKNAFYYGFILSYPKGLEDFTGYTYEPWHYRYVGKDVSYVIYNYFGNNLELFLQWYWSCSELF